MIVELEQVKDLLGIDQTDTSEDEHLTQLILAATEFVQRETHQRFDVPIPRTDYVVGTGRREMYIRGHIDERPSTDAPESADPLALIAVHSRLIGDNGEWLELVEGTDYERRDDTLMAFGVLGAFWDRCLEYRLHFMDGYQTAPEDIQQLILELVSRQYTVDNDLASGTAGVTSEKIGDYSYTVDLGAAASISGSVLSTSGWMVINTYKRRLV